MELVPAGDEAGLSQHRSCRGDIDVRPSEGEHTHHLRCRQTTDATKGLIAAVSRELPLVTHGHCAVHIFHNIKSKYGKRPAKAFKGLVHAEDQTDFEKCLKDIREKWPVAAEYITAIPPVQYANYAFPSARFGLTSSNVCEQTNSWFRTCPDAANRGTL